MTVVDCWTRALGIDGAAEGNGCDAKKGVQCMKSRRDIGNH